jgi:hypothetical protein
LRDGLLDAVFKDAEVILLQVGYKLPRAIFYSDGHNNERNRRPDAPP